MRRSLERGSGKCVLLSGCMSDKNRRVWTRTALSQLTYVIITSGYRKLSWPAGQLIQLGRQHRLLAGSLYWNAYLPSGIRAAGWTEKNRPAFSTSKIACKLKSPHAKSWGDFNLQTGFNFPCRITSIQTVKLENPFGIIIQNSTRNPLGSA